MTEARPGLQRMQPLYIKEFKDYFFASLGRPNFPAVCSSTVPVTFYTVGLLKLSGGGSCLPSHNAVYCSRIFAFLLWNRLEVAWRCSRH